MDEDIKSNVGLFICANIDSVEQLDILLLLFTNPDRRWTSTEVSSVLRSNVSSTFNRMKCLADRKIITFDSQDESFWYSVQNEKTHILLEHLFDAYRTHKYRVIELIFNKSQFAMNAFANAFRIR